MKVRTHDLTTKQMSFLVSMIEMPHLVWGDTIGIHAHSSQIIVPELNEPDCYTPYMGWDMFGDIVEREGIDIYCNVPTNRKHKDVAWRGSWAAQYHRCGIESERYYGNTAIIAAVKCFIAHKLGENIELPDELV